MTAARFPQVHELAARTDPAGDNRRRLGAWRRRLAAARLRGDTESARIAAGFVRDYAARVEGN